MKHSVFIITALCLLLSCSKGDSPEQRPSGQTVKIRLLVQETASTKTLPQVSEALLADLNLLVYDSKGSLTEHMFIESPGSEVIVEIDRNDDSMLYAIANTGDLSDSEEILSVNGLLGLRWRIENPGDISGPDGCIPMSGILPLKNVDNNTSLTLYLTRLLSKFRIIVDTSGLDDDVTTFDITRVTIRNMNKSVGYFTPAGASSDYDIMDIGLTAEGDELDRLFTYGLDFYVPENIHGDLLSGNESEQAHIPPSSHSDLCTYVEFYVKYRNSEHYNDNLIYRYYLHDGDNLDNFDIVRNTMYTCRTLFNGTGLEDNSWRVDQSGMKDLVTEITVIPSEVTFVEKGKLRKLTALVTPASAENPEVVWSSDNEKVATVTQDGIVMSTGDGRCTITASATDGSGVSGSSEISVFADSKYFIMDDIPDVIYHRYDSPYQLRYNVFPFTIPILSIECLSGNADGAAEASNMIMTYNPTRQQGEIGTYRLTAQANGITVQDEFSVSAGYVDINNVFSNFYLGIPSRLSFNRLEPADVELTLTASDPSMVDILPDGRIIPQKTGKCTITATSVTEASDIININILEPYISFVDVTMYEGATWELSSGLRPVSADLPIEYSVVQGHEHVSISGNLMKGLKRTDGFNDVIIKASLVDYPQVYATARVRVVPAVQATLTGDNKVVNTYGLTSDGSSWNFKNYLSLDIEHAPNVSMTWEVRDEDGQLSSEIQISENGTINPYSSTANGKYFITGWDHLHRFSTDRIEIEVYRLLEYECGLGAYGSTTVNGRNVYVVTLIARWSNPTWNIILNNGYTSAMLQNSLITYPHVSTAYHSIGSPTSAKPYIQNFTTNIAYYSTQNVINALSSLKPLSYLRDDFSTHAGNSSGINGKYYKFTTAQNGFDGYFFIKQRNESFYNSSDYR